MTVAVPLEPVHHRNPKSTMTKRSRKPVLFLAALGLMLAAAVLLWALLRPDPDPFQGAAVVDPPFTPITYSIQTGQWWDAGQAGVQLEWVTWLLGFSHVKEIFPWREMEPAPGVWDFSIADRIVEEVTRRDLQLIVRLGQAPEWAAPNADWAEVNYETHDAPPDDLADWANYCGTIAERYAGRVAAYQIWNEPNLAREWGGQTPDAAAYVEMLAACSEAIRAVDEEAILISAGLSPTGTHGAIATPDDVYLDAMYRLDFQQYIDVVGVHAPGFAPPAYGPDDAAADGLGRWASFRRVEDLRKIMLLYDDAARQMAVLEFGWTTDRRNPDYAWFAVSEEQQAQYIVEAYQYAAEHWRPWVGLMSLIYLPSPQWTEDDEEWWWSITTPAGYVRPAFYAIVSMDRYCGDRIVHGWPDDTPEEVYREQRITCP